MESALVRVHVTGAVTVYTGTSPHGQGLETSFAQIVADKLGVDPQAVDVMHGDTSQGPWGLDTYGSRSLAVGGEAIARASDKVVEKVRAIVAHKLEAAPEDIELNDGTFSVKGSPGSGLTLAEVSGMAYIPEDNLPAGMEPGLEETSFYDPENFVFPFGAHAAVVEIDPETGKVDLVRYVAVDDCGPAINPMLIDGQVHGGITHAVGQALFEQVVLRRERPARDRLVRLLRAPERRRAAELRDRPDGDPVAGQLARGQGRRRGGHDRRQRRRHERRHRRPAPARRRVHEHAAHPDAGVGDAPGEGRCPRMIPAEFDYVAPESLDAALAALRDGGEDAKLLAGGHSLVPLMKLRLAAPTLLVDLRRVPGLSGIRRNGAVSLGAMTPHHDVAVGELGLASMAAATIADQQVRNRGTVGGSLAHGDPASDMPAVLLALEGSVIARGPDGEREIAAADLFLDYLTTSVGEDEILTEVRIPGARRLGRGLREVQPPRRGLGHGRGLRRGQEGAGRLLRGRPRRADQHGQRAAARRRRRGRAARRGARRGRDRVRRRAGRRGHRPAGGPQRVLGLQAPSGPRALPPRAGGGGRGGVSLAAVGDVEQALVGEGYLPDRGLATAVYLAVALEQPLLLEGEAGVGKTEVARALASATGARLIRLQCHEGIDLHHALYDWDYQRQLLAIRAAEAGAEARGAVRARSSCCGGRCSTRSRPTRTSCC